MSAQDLAVCISNHFTDLHQALAALATGRLDLYFSIGVDYRMLALCALLRDADVDTYCDFLARSGQVRQHFLENVARPAGADPRIWCLSKDLFFPASLAAGDLETARAIAVASPRRHEPAVEYEDDFLFVHFLHRALVGTPQELDAILARWETVLEGNSSARFEVCRALASSRQDELDHALHGLVSQRQRELEAYRKSLRFHAEEYAAEGHVFVDGLAVLRLAELRNLKTEPEYPLLPRAARVPLGKRLPPPGAWRSP